MWCPQMISSLLPLMPLLGMRQKANTNKTPQWVIAVMEPHLFKVVWPKSFYPPKWWVISTILDIGLSSEIKIIWNELNRTLSFTDFGLVESRLKRSTNICMNSGRFIKVWRGCWRIIVIFIIVTFSERAGLEVSPSTRIDCPNFLRGPGHYRPA